MPEQIVVNTGVAIAIGVGFTLIVERTGNPTQVLKVGVTV